MSIGIDEKTEAMLDAKPSPLQLANIRLWPGVSDMFNLRFFCLDGEKKIRRKDVERMITYLQRWVSWTKRHGEKEKQIGDLP